jgi:hypothetical protein
MSVILPEHPPGFVAVPPAGSRIDQVPTELAMSAWRAKKPNPVVSSAITPMTTQDARQRPRDRASTPLYQSRFLAVKQREPGSATSRDMARSRAN